MTTVDTYKSIITELFDTLTEDATLKTAMGGTVKACLHMAPTDEDMPYLVHVLSIRDTDFYPIQQGTYTVNIYSTTLADEALAIRKRIVELLDQQLLDTDDVKHIQVEKYSEGFVTEDSPGTWHYVIVFNLRFYRTSEVDSIVNRS